MHINNNLHITNNPRVRKNDANVNSQSVDNSKDFINSPNPAEYIGRSQVVFHGRSTPKPEEKQFLPEFKKEDLQPIKFVKNNLIPKEEAIAILKQLSFTDEDISKIDLNNPELFKNISGLKHYLDIDDFKNGYVFGGYRESDRRYVSELIKEAKGMSDEEYVKFVEKNKDKQMTEIQPKELQDKIVKKLATINSNHRKGNRSYNEMYILNPKTVMGVFAYEMNESKKIEPLEFLEENNQRTEFLKEYALEHDVPFYVFGD